MLATLDYSRDAVPSHPAHRLPDAWRAAFGQRRLVLVSNRGPREHVVGAGGRVHARRGSGGVVTALEALTRDVPATWIAAAMTEGDRRVAADPSLAPAAADCVDLTPRLVALPEPVYQRYYGAFSNGLLWFLQHGMLDAVYGGGVDAAGRRAWDDGYVTANRAFAAAIRDEATRLAEPPVVLIHDYQLYLVAGLARALGVRATFQHFVHIPWPAPEQWAFLPPDIRRAICAGLVANDVVGFQTASCARNFLATCAAYLDDAVVDFAARTVSRGDHRCHARVYPISIDVAGLRRLAAGSAVGRYRASLDNSERGQVIARVDRLEPSKNILRGFAAYDALLQGHPELRGRITFRAFLVPSRTQLAEYRRYRREVMAAVERIQARHARDGWRPIEVFYENNYAQAIAGMALADVLFVNPIADGMNLVAKEGPIVNERNGVLVLSEGAGAYEQLREGALGVAPGDVPGTAAALYRALTMPEPERIARLSCLRQQIEREDLDWWMRRQVAELGQLAGHSAPAPVAAARRDPAGVLVAGRARTA